MTMPTTTNYIWDEQNYLAEADGTNTIQTVYTNEPNEYGNLISSRISGNTSYHHFDATGSTRQVSTAAGAVSDTVIYDAWGNVANRTGTTGLAFLWVGEAEYYFDVETGLFYVRARSYGPAIGRWCAMDPARFRDALNRFQYARRKPVDAIDPSGRVSIRWVSDNFSPPKKLRCGDTSLVDFLFNFDNGATTPCTGFMVQHIRVWCATVDCRKGYAICPQSPSLLTTVFVSPEPPQVEFWEAFPVTFSNDAPFHSDTIGALTGSSDQSTVKMPKETCGYSIAFGEVQLFCKDRMDAAEHESAESGDLGKAWKTKTSHKPKNQPPIGQACSVTSNFLSTEVRPSFWDLGIGATGDRWTKTFWQCCKCMPKAISASSSPTKG